MKRIQKSDLPKTKKWVDQYGTHYRKEFPNGWYATRSKGYGLSSKWELFNDEDVWVGDSRTLQDLINLYNGWMYFNSKRK